MDMRRDRVRLALRGDHPDRIPMTLAFWEESLPDIAPVTPTEHFGLDVQFAGFDPPSEQDDYLHYLRSLPADVHIGDAAQLRTYHEWDYHPELGPDGPLSRARSIEELMAYRLPDLTAPHRYHALAERVAGWHAEGWAVAGGPPHLGGELFETAWRLRGFETFLVDLRLRPHLAGYLLDQLAALTLQNAVILAEAGVDVLLLDDDVAMPTGLLIGPATWREFFKPRLADIIRTVRSIAPDVIVFYHSDGDFSSLIPDLVEIGVNVINPIQPDCMDGAAIRREFGEKLAFWGTVGSAALWDHGTPDQVRAEVRRRIAMLGPRGLLLSPAYDIDFAPYRNIVAFCDAVQEYGR